MALHDISSTPWTQWEIDPENTSIEFSIGKSPLHRVRGRFHGVRGWVVAPGDRVNDANVQVEIEAASIDTRFKVRDWHLRTGQFLKVNRFPTISFMSTRVDDLGQNALRVAGELTICGITRQVTMDATVAHRDEDRAQVTAHTMLDVRDFRIGPKAMGLVVGNSVAVQITLVLQARSNPA